MKFPGTNCDAETARALRSVGFDAEIAPISTVTRASLEGVSLVVLSGGFSYGDYVMSGRLASLVTEQRIDDALRNADMLGKRLGVVTAKVGVLSDGANSQSRAIIIENGRRTTLEVDAAGRINVTVAEGDNESVEAYDNIDQLKAARPELATKFEGVLRNLTPAKAEDKK